MVQNSQKQPFECFTNINIYSYVNSNAKPFSNCSELDLAYVFTLKLAKNKNVHLKKYYPFSSKSMFNVVDLGFLCTEPVGPYVVLHRGTLEHVLPGVVRSHLMLRSLLIFLLRLHSCINVLNHDYVFITSSPPIFLILAL